MSDENKDFEGFESDRYLDEIIREATLRWLAKKKAKQSRYDSGYDDVTAGSSNQRYSSS